MVQCTRCKQVYKYPSETAFQGTVRCRCGHEMEVASALAAAIKAREDGTSAAGS
jgi:hypothetical protein